MTKGLLKVIANYIKGTRNNRGISQNQFAKQLNMGQPLLSRIENGHHNVSLSKYVLVLHALNSEFTLSDYGYVTGFFNELRFANKDRLLQYKAYMLANHSSYKTINEILSARLVQAYLAYFDHDVEQLESLVMVLSEFVDCLDSKFSYRLYQLKGLVAIKNRQYKHAEQLLVSAHRYALKCEAEDELILYQRGWIYTKEKNITQSCLCLYEAKRYAEKSGNWKRMVDIENLLAINYMTDYEPDLAINYFNRCHQSPKAKQDPYFKSQLIYNLGLCYYLKKEYEKAANYFEESFNMDDKRQDHGLTLSYLLNTLIILDDQKRISIYEPHIESMMNEKHQTGEIFVKLVEIELTQGKSEDYYLFLKKEIIPQLNPSYNRIRLRLLYEELSQFYWKHKQYKNYKMIVDQMMNLIT